MTPKQDHFIDNLYREQFDNMVEYAFSRLQNWDLAQDVVQDAFHVAVERVADLVSHENPVAWLKLTVKNKTRECFRTRTKQMMRFRSIEDYNQDLPDSRHDPNLMFTTDTYPEMIEKIKKKLSKEDFHIFCRICLDHASHLTVSKELDISVWACQKRLERAKKKLQKIF